MDWSQIMERPELLLMALAPIFFLCIAAEYGLGQRRGKLPDSAQYYLPEVACNFVLAGLHQAADILTGLLIAHFYLWMFDWRLFDIEMSVSAFLLLMLLQDFFYYWFHRASHRIRWMWAAHVVHHSSERMNFSTAFRQSLMYPLAGMWLFWLPLVIIGFDPKWVVFVVLLNLGLQFFVHTQLIRSLGPLEWVFNTPSHHRVHHGINRQYIDKNYAGVLIIWDRMFGTFEPEIETVRYGISKPVNSFNPIKVTFAEWKDMFNEVRRPNLTWQQRWRCLFAPPSDSTE
ncbi:sterol desaturase family protein [Vibrio parahaemolyticus]|uniref:sterol desaturase family protein n=1 Tax=Vibrio parahaemolyticus TaxID=670 RepID=UPI0004200E9B|nr:sterol desaturase family protein [Vibrio parahaemolyticus]EHR6000617.1 sterol desaturase family protein [Vibrio parahaemolyticus]EJG0631808.1 sterol desaturase family protein [Vibrio parahaemolyticus]EJG0738076.1 sterol desaturase family protein [Vibrio parahaemolyticus]EJG0914725.1 sterol desaturase family protein [Vibrio parahaemolyticus]MBE3931878.1 sterol desaturase family protein [Vibrio parahaemolyticus]